MYKQSQSASSSQLYFLCKPEAFLGVWMTPQSDGLHTAPAPLLEDSDLPPTETQCNVCACIETTFISRFL